MSSTAENVNQMIPLETVNAVEIFSEDGTKLDHLLALIETEAKAHVPDLSNDTGRKAVASNAYKVARSKTTIDDAGKDLVSGIKKQAVVIDARRKHARDFLDRVRDEVRAPLNEWEALEAEKEADARRQAEKELDHMEAIRENELFDREAAVKQQQAELKAKQDEQDIKDLEAARVENEQRMKEEAEERGRQQAAAALQRAEEGRLLAISLAESGAQKARLDQEAAVEAERQKAQEAAKAVERDRKDAEDQKAREDAARAADKANRDKVHAAITTAMFDNGIGALTAERVLRLMVSGGIPHVTVRY